MKQFSVWMKKRSHKDGTLRWMPAHMPNQGNQRFFNSKSDAEEQKGVLERAWNEYEEKWGKLYPSRDSVKTGMCPTEFKIMSRDVTEWEDIK